VIAKETAAVARRLGHEPRVPVLFHLRQPTGRWLEPLRDAIAILDAEKPGFEYEGEMAPDAALNPTVMAHYPFCRLSAPANVLIFPGLQSANIAAAAARTGRQHGHRPAADRHGKAGADRADDRHRAGRVTLAILAASGVVGRPGEGLPSPGPLADRLLLTVY
jgi:malate dehydrogenase (oxaloacetate-decarboxylating)(NADP+)